MPCDIIAVPLAWIVNELIPSTFAKIVGVVVVSSTTMAFTGLQGLVPMHFVVTDVTIPGSFAASFFMPGEPL